MRFTAATVNKALKAAGHPERLVQGNGYAFFSGGDAPLWPESGVYGTNRIADVPKVDYWLQQRDRLAAAWQPGNPEDYADGIIHIRG